MNSADAPVSMVISQKNPAILALKRGDASAFLSAIRAARIALPPYPID
jgi:hypothetical protein